ncbi:MAG: hypothetical protein ACTSX9_04705 [Candidatus Njordarchaeales archaeon]
MVHYDVIAFFIIGSFFALISFFVWIMITQRLYEYHQIKEKRKEPSIIGGIVVGVKNLHMRGDTASVDRVIIEKGEKRFVLYADLGKILIKEEPSKKEPEDRNDLEPL